MASEAKVTVSVHRNVTMDFDDAIKGLKNGENITVPPLTINQTQAIRVFSDLVEKKGTGYLQSMQFLFRNPDVYKSLKEFFDNITIGKIVDTPKITTKKRIDITTTSTTTTTVNDDTKSHKSWADQVSDEESDDCPDEADNKIQIITKQEPVQNDWKTVVLKKKKQLPVASEPKMQIVEFSPKKSWAEINKIVAKMQNELVTKIGKQFNYLDVDSKIIEIAFQGDQVASTYKTIPCNYGGNECKHGAKCHFAHTEQEQFHIGHSAMIYKILGSMDDYESLHDPMAAHYLIEFLKYISNKKIA